MSYLLIFQRDAYKHIPRTSTVAKFLTAICNLRDYDTSRTKRQVNAFSMSNSRYPPNRLRGIKRPSASAWPRT